MTSLQEQLRRTHSCRMTLADEQPAREEDYDQRPHHRYRCANGCGREHVQRNSLATAGPLWCYATLPEPQIIYASHLAGTTPGCESAKNNLPLKYCLCLPGIRGRSRERQIITLGDAFAYHSGHSTAHLPGGGHPSPYGQ